MREEWKRNETSPLFWSVVNWCIKISADRKIFRVSFKKERKEGIQSKRGKALPGREDYLRRCVHTLEKG